MELGKEIIKQYLFESYKTDQTKKNSNKVTMLIWKNNNESLIKSTAQLVFDLGNTVIN